MSISYIKLFNTLMDQFFNELLVIFPEESRIKVNYTLFQTICKANAKKPAKDFMEEVIPYLEKIAARDETVFTDDNKPDVLKKLRFERLWNDDLSPNTKNAIWRYIQKFLEIGVQIIQVPSEKQDIINYIISC